MCLDNLNHCPICGEKLRGTSCSDDLDTYFFNCHSCGRYAMTTDFYVKNIEHQKTDIGKGEIASYLYYNEDKVPFPYLCNEDAVNITSHSKVTVSNIRNWYPKTFSEKVDTFLLGLVNRMSFYGEPILFSNEELCSAVFVNRNPQGPMKNHPDVYKEQALFFTKYLIEQEYIKQYVNGYIIQPKGLERVDGLQKNLKNTSKNVFISMSFSDNTLDTRETLRKAITDSGFSPEFIDEIIHNKQIIPEMFRLIRESRFLILEISDPNYGAYYEAGYALGLGKEVIICCSEETFYRKYESEEEKKFEKYLKPHFDIAQKQILLWKDYDDLRKKLAEWIKALFS